MACHKCVYTGEKTCNAQEAKIKCLICGRCEAERIKEEQNGGETVACRSSEA